MKNVAKQSIDFLAIRAPLCHWNRLFLKMKTHRSCIQLKLVQLTYLVESFMVDDENAAI